MALMDRQDKRQKQWFSYLPQCVAINGSVTSNRVAQDGLDSSPTTLEESRHTHL